MQRADSDDSDADLNSRRLFTSSQGKEAARKMLRQQLNLAQVDVPIVSCVTRLVAQKVRSLVFE